MKVLQFIGVLRLCLFCTVAIASFACPVQAKVLSRTPATTAKAASFDGLPFPRQIAGLNRHERADYKEPGLGFSVSYGKRGLVWADIYVYDRQRDLRSEAAIPLARKEMEAAIDEIHAAMKAGMYENVVLEEQSVSGPFAKARLTILAGGTERNSYIFITVRSGKFVKIRLSSTAGSASDRIANGFLTEYSRLLGKP